MALRIPGEFWDLRLAKVTYNERIQKQRIDSLLKQAFIAIADSLIGARAAGAERAQLLADTVLYVAELLLDDIVTFKNPAFEEENEWRLIARPSLIRTQMAQQSEEEAASFKFRESRGSLVPYLELLPRAEKIPLRSVRYGPSLEGSRVENPVRMLLAGCGFQRIGVTGSELPVIL